MVGIEVTLASPFFFVLSLLHALLVICECVQWRLQTLVGILGNTVRRPELFEFKLQISEPEEKYSKSFYGRFFKIVCYKQVVTADWAAWS